MTFLYRKKYLVFIVVTALLGVHRGTGSAQNFATSEYEIKAAFLFNFAKFVGWPAGATKDTD